MQPQNLNLIVTQGNYLNFRTWSDIYCTKGALLNQGKSYVRYLNTKKLQRISNKRSLTQITLRHGLTWEIALKLNKTFLLHKNIFPILTTRGENLDIVSLIPQITRWVKEAPSTKHQHLLIFYSGVSQTRNIPMQNEPWNGFEIFPANGVTN